MCRSSVMNAESCNQSRILPGQSQDLYYSRVVEFYKKNMFGEKITTEGILTAGCLCSIVNLLFASHSMKCKETLILMLRSQSSKVRPKQL